MLRQAEEAEQSGAPEATQMVTVGVHRERWDCESVLSLRSNLDNHPARIAEPGRGSRKPRAGLAASVGGQPGRITLSAKTGLPISAAEQTGAGRRPDGDDVTSVSTQRGYVAPPRKGETAEERKARKTATKEANVRSCRCSCLLTAEQALRSSQAFMTVQRAHAHRMAPAPAEKRSRGKEGAQAGFQGRDGPAAQGDGGARCRHHTFALRQQPTMLLLRAACLTSTPHAVQRQAVGRTATVNVQRAYSRCQCAYHKT